MQRLYVSIAKTAVIAAMVIVPGIAKADIYSWHFGSGLFPDQVDPTMVSFGGSRDLQPDGLYVESNQILMSYYEQSGANIVRPDHFVLKTRLRVPYDYSQIPEVRSGTMIHVALGGNVGINLGIANDVVYYTNVPETERIAAVSVDTDEFFHDYRLEINTTSRSFAFFQDDVMILSGITPGAYGGLTRIYWGDGTQYASGLGIWQSFEHNAAAVPEPASGLVVFGALCAALRRRRKSTKK